MNQRIKIGNVYVDIPEGTATSARFGLEPQSLVATKSDTPEPLEEQPYLYQPNDPFRSSLDQVRAVTSISSSHKPWVRKTWFVVFVVVPILFIELFAFAIAYLGDGNKAKALGAFVAINLFTLPICFFYLTVWRRKVRRNAETKAKSADG
jgi:hypothetical protein